MKELFVIVSRNYRRTVPIKKKFLGLFRRSRIKAYQILPTLLARKIISMKTLYEEYSSKTFLKKLIKSCMVLSKEDTLF